MIMYNGFEYVDPKNIITSNKGKLLPEYEFTDMETKYKVPTSELPKTAIYYIFSPTCKYCIKQHYYIEKLREKLPDINHIGISWYKNDEASERWVNQHAKGLFDQVLFMHSEELPYSLDIYGIPHTLIVINRQIEFQSVGLLQNATINNHIIPLFQPK
ncbi:MAG: hypothetical protein BGO27_08030 [Alphaproteobacteria bacterium 33-17]|nr:MAG: hypothetical protein BGO27_08030 [Alphaproteobacteria bacterium 33-17]